MTSAFPGVAYPGLTYPGVVETGAYAGEPSITVEIAFDSPALSASPLWTDVTDYVRALTVKRGRNMELSQFDAGGLEITLDNNDGRFTPRLTPNAGQPTLRPRRAARATATLGGTTYALGYGFIERWPAEISNGDLTVTVSAPDAFRILSGTSAGNSDTALLERARPDHFWTMQETEADTILDTVGTAHLSPYFASIFTTSGIAQAAISNAIPAIGYGSDSILPSHAGTCLDMGGYWVSGNVHGANALQTWLPGTGISVPGVTSYTLSCQVSLPTLTHPDGSSAVLFGASDTVLNSGNPLLRVDPNGAVTFGTVSTPAGWVKAGPAYRITVSTAPSTPASVQTVTIGVNGSTWTDVMTGAPLGGNVLTIGGLPANGGSGAGARFSHAAMWTRALSDTEIRDLHTDSLAGPNMLANARFNKVLDYIGWPAARRDLQAGASKLARDSWSDGTSALSLFQGWADSDQGLFYVAADGDLTYRNRWDRLTADRTPALTLNSGGNVPEAVEQGLEWVMDEDDITNVVKVSTPLGGDSVFRNESSIADYGEKPADISLKVQSRNEGRAAAEWRLYRYADAMVRVNGLAIYPSAAESGVLWQAAMTLDINSVIRLDNLPSSAPASRLDYFVESVTHEISRDGSRLVWRTSYDVSPVPTDRVWILGDVGSALGTNTRLTY